jgi:hypothetical protein
MTHGAQVPLRPVRTVLEALDPPGRVLTLPGSLDEVTGASQLPGMPVSAERTGDENEYSHQLRFKPVIANLLSYIVSNCYTLLTSWRPNALHDLENIIPPLARLKSRISLHDARDRRNHAKEHGQYENHTSNP